jgi:hypothetical protein
MIFRLIIYTIAGVGGMKSQNLHVGDEKGIAVLLGLFMLFVVTIAGISLIYIAQKDKIAATDSAAIRKVAIAANASLMAFESQLQLKPDTVAAILTKYAADTNYKWLLGSSTASALNETKLVIGTSDLKCSARITAYDKTKQILQIKGTGYGSTNEQKSVYSLYKLNGVETATADSGQKTNYVLYLAGNGRYFNARVNVTGDIYCGSDFGFNSGADSSAIHGMIKSGVNTTLLGDFNAKGLIIDSLLYIGTGLRVNQPFTCKSKAGFEGKLIINGIITMKSEAWFNDTNEGNAAINMSSKIIHHSGHIGMARVTNGTEDNKHTQILDIANQVGLGSTNDSAWTINTATLFAKALSISGGIDAASLQTMFNSCPAANKVNGYMVVYDQWGSVAINSNATVFNGKVIWLLKYGLNVNKNFFKMTATSRMLIYAYDWATLGGFGGPNGMQFNGLVFLTDHASITMSWDGINAFNGAIHLASPTTGWTCNGGVGLVLNLVYNEEILTEFETMGIFHRPSQGGTPSASPAGAVVLTDCKIRPHLVGVRH